MQASGDNLPEFGRRHFFRGLLSEAIAAAEEAAGRPQLRLSDVKKLSDEAIALIIPRVSEDYELDFGEGGQIVARHKKTGKVIPLVAPQSPELAIFNLFDGQRTIGSVSEEISRITSCPASEAFASVKALFLKLVDLRICLPANPIEESSLQDAPGRTQSPREQNEACKMGSDLPKRNTAFRSM